VSTQEEQAARLVWQYGEPIHAVLFFAPETVAATDGLGPQGRLDELLRLPRCTSRYGASRGGDLDLLRLSPATGRARAFPPPGPTPSRDSSSRPTVGDGCRAGSVAWGEAIDGPDVRRAASLATTAVHSADFTGRPLGAANAALADPGVPHLQLWQALGAIREHRGDGPCHVPRSQPGRPVRGACYASGDGALRTGKSSFQRGWSDEEWRTAALRLRERGMA